MPAILSTLRKTGAIFMPKQHIYLLSHMRAYTTLFGHIMGSNPAICGYYEMHIGYHSWKSSYRQKLLYFREEKPKPGFTFMFDKILHNDHNVSLDVLNGQRARTIMSLRHPRDAIPSIIKLYNDNEPGHEFTDPVFATDYYIHRLDKLETIANALEREFFYLDAESMKLDTEECLRDLSEWLGLATPLSSDYEIQQNTSKERCGDTSELIRSGHVCKTHTEYSKWLPDQQLIAGAEATYRRVRDTLIRRSERTVIADIRRTASQN